MSNTINIKNKKAFHDYEITDKMECGICLMGTEIKSIRAGKANVRDSFCYFKDNELYVRNMHIAQYSHGGYVNHEPTRERKLLMHGNELRRLQRKIKEKGFTLIALRLYINDKGLAKLEIGLARGKKQYDKREDLKRKDMNRQIDRLS